MARGKSIDTSDIPEADEAWFQKAKLRCPAAQPRGTRDGSRALRGKTVYVVSLPHGAIGAFTTLARAKAWIKQTCRPYAMIDRVKIIK
jgi:hypothetical protein